MDSLDKLPRMDIKNLVTENCTLVTGGRSPIAVDIAKRVSLNSKVLLLTRDASHKDLSHLHSNKNIVIQEANLLQSSFVSEFELILRKFNVANLCFAHRLSSIEYSSTQRFLGEVTRPAELIESLNSIQRGIQKRVVILTSPASQYVIDDQDLTYHINKSSLSTLVKFFAVNFATNNFVINAVAPGSFVTKERSKEYYEEHQLLYQGIISSIPSRKFTSPKDISDFVEFLIHKAPMTLNGTEIVIDSGLTLIEQSTFARRMSKNYSL